MEIARISGYGLGSHQNSKSFEVSKNHDTCQSVYFCKTLDVVLEEGV